MKIEFVILHYNVEKETIKCIEYIKHNIDVEDYHIVIVDNNSPNGSGKRLKEYYKSDRKVKVILMKSNAGFARGNNAGIRWARKNTNPKYICVMNNDVYLLEKNLYKKIDDEYNNSKFAALGPHVRTPRGRTNTNPINDRCISKRDIYLYLAEYSIRLCMCRLNIEDRNIKEMFMKLRTKKNPMNSKIKQYNVKLHGCFLVFSEMYFQKFDGLDSRTFMYWEEEILYRHLTENKLISVYEPDIDVLHKEDMSTDSEYKKSKDKKIFHLRCSISSFRVLLKVIKHYEKC